MASNEDLERAQREIHDLKVALAASSTQAQSATEEMQLFVYAVSHDLRQPLRTIAGFAQLLKRQYANDVETSELTSLIADGVTEMNTLIEELLKYSRVSTSPSRTMVNVSAVVQWAWANLQKQVLESGAQIIFQDLAEVPVDESQFVQLFQQLFANAIKFRTAEPPRINVTVEEDGECYTVAVRDNGIGIEPKYHELIFAPFKRLHGKDVPGIGLGLAACRKIVRAHGGEIWVESELSHGSVFKVTVPT